MAFFVESTDDNSYFEDLPLPFKVEASVGDDWIAPPGQLSIIWVSGDSPSSFPDSCYMGNLEFTYECFQLGPFAL